MNKMNNFPIFSPYATKVKHQQKVMDIFIELVISHLSWVVARLTTEAFTIFTIFSVENTQMHYITMISEDF